MITRTRRPVRPFDARDQEERSFRAKMTAGDYTITLHDGSFILEKLRGDSYIVSEDCCSCFDFTYRVSKVAGARCKHGHMVGNWLLEQGLTWDGEVLR